MVGCRFLWECKPTPSTRLYQNFTDPFTGRRATCRQSCANGAKSKLSEIDIFSCQRGQPSMLYHVVKFQLATCLRARSRSFWNCKTRLIIFVIIFEPKNRSRVKMWKNEIFSGTCIKCPYMMIPYWFFSPRHRLGLRIDNVRFLSPCFELFNIGRPKNR